MADTRRDVLPVQTPEDIVLVRHAVRRWTADLGFRLVDQTKVVTAASELARNTVDYGGGGTVQLEVCQEGDRVGLRLTFEDQGPGIPDVDLAMKEQWQVTFDAISDGMCVLDAAGNVVRCNRAMEAFLGKPLAAIEGRPSRELLEERLGAGTGGLPAPGAFRGREVWEKELGGAWYRLSFDPIRDGQGGVTGAVQVVTDVTARRRVEAAEEEARASAALVERLQREVGELEQMVRRFGGPPG